LRFGDRASNFVVIVSAPLNLHQQIAVAALLLPRKSRIAALPGAHFLNPSDEIPAGRRLPPRAGPPAPIQSPKRAATIPNEELNAGILVPTPSRESRKTTQSQLALGSGDGARAACREKNSHFVGVWATPKNFER
jgi:hypothetical protein